MSLLYAKSLPESACRVAHHTDVTTVLNEVCNFTIVSNTTKEYELLLTAQPDMHTLYMIPFMYNS